MVESSKRFPLGLREALPGLDKEKRRLLLKGLVDTSQRNRLISEHGKLVDGYTLPLRDEELVDNMADEMIVYRVKHSELLLRIWTMSDENRISALRCLLGLEPDARVTHFSDN